MEFDHIAICGTTLAQATAHAQDTLGVTLQTGGVHERFGTHNTLLGLEQGLYLEALSAMPDAPKLDQPRMFGVDLHQGPARLTNWICRCDDIDAVLATLPDGFGAPVSVARGDLRWRMAVPSAGYLPFDNCAPALIQWQGDLRPSQMLTPSGCALTALRVSHPEAPALQALLQPHLSDARVTFQTGAAGLQARFDTPDGPRTL